MVRQFIIFFIFFVATRFYFLSFMPHPVMLALLFVIPVFLILAWAYWVIYYKGKDFPRNFNMEVSFFILATLLAMVGAQIGHGQNFLLSAWSQAYMFFYFLYFFFHLTKLRPEELERIMMILGVVYLTIYFAQYVLYPKLITYARVSVERGTVRIFIPGGAYAKFVFFYFFHLLLRTNKLKYSIFCIAYLLIPILQGTRSAIATMMFISLIYILFNKYVKSRLATITLAGLAGVMFLFIFQDIFMNLLEVSNTQAAQEEDDIRVRAATFFLTELFTNDLNYILGNGIGHMRSAYGLKMMYYKATHGFYQSDVGIIGAYSIFGVFYILGIFFTIRKIFITQVQARYNYIKFWGLLMIIEAFMNWTFMDVTGIATICGALYIIDISNYELNYEKKLVYDRLKQNDT